MRLWLALPGLKRAADRLALAFRLHPDLLQAVNERLPGFAHVREGSRAPHRRRPERDWTAISSRRSSGIRGGGSTSAPDMGTCRCTSAWQPRRTEADPAEAEWEQAIDKRPARSRLQKRVRWSTREDDPPTHPYADRSPTTIPTGMGRAGTRGGRGLLRASGLRTGDRSVARRFYVRRDVNVTTSASHLRVPEML